MRFIIFILVLFLSYFTSCKKENNITIPDLSERIGLSTRAVEKQIKKLQNENKLVRIGPDKGGYWQVINIRK